MALSPVVKTLDGLDENIAALYVEDGDRFILDIDDTIQEHPATDGVKKALSSEREAAKKAKEDAAKAKADLAEALKDKPDEAEVLKLREKLEAERDEWKGKATDLEGKLTGVTRDQALATALTEAGVTNPAFQKAATAMLGSQVKMVDGKAVVETDMGPVEVAQHVKRWAASEGKDFVTPPSGGGAKTKDGGQPKSGGIYSDIPGFADLPEN